MEYWVEFRKDAKTIVGNEAYKPLKRINKKTFGFLEDLEGVLPSGFTVQEGLLAIRLGRKLMSGNNYIHYKGQEVAIVYNK